VCVHVCVVGWGGVVVVVGVVVGVCMCPRPSPGAELLVSIRLSPSMLVGGGGVVPAVHPLTLCPSSYPLSILLPAVHPLTRCPSSYPLSILLPPPLIHHTTVS
jgi:hypothetical protein